MTFADRRLRFAPSAAETADQTQQDPSQKFNVLDIGAVVDRLKDLPAALFLQATAVAGMGAALPTEQSMPSTSVKNPSPRNGSRGFYRRS
jgi:hypothetical protein